MVLPFLCGLRTVFDYSQGCLEKGFVGATRQPSDILTRSVWGNLFLRILVDFLIGRGLKFLCNIRLFSYRQPLYKEGMRFILLPYKRSFKENDPARPIQKW